MDSLIETIEMYQKVMEEGYQETGDAYLIINSETGDEENLSNLFFDSSRKIKEVIKQDKTVFLTYPIMEYTFRKLMEVYVLKAADIISGRAQEKIDHILELQKALDKSEVKKDWGITISRVKKILGKAGLRYSDSELQDITLVEDALYQALLFFDEKVSHLRVHKVRDGRPGTGKTQYITHIGEFRFPSEFVKTLEAAPYERIIAFGAIIPTYGQTEDKMFEYVHGYPEERTRNIMRNDKKTYQELVGDLDIRNSYITIGIRDGKKIYLITCGVDSDMLVMQSVYRYGKRGTYLPIQVLFQEPPQPDKDTYQLVSCGCRRHWDLRNVMDSKQSLWLAIVYNSINDKFFEMGGREFEDLELELMSEEKRVTFIENNGRLECKQKDKEYGCQLPAVKEYLEVSLKSIGLTEYDYQLLKDLNIKEAMLKEAPIEVIGCIMNNEHLDEMIRLRIRDSLHAVVRDRLLIALFVEFNDFLKKYSNIMYSRETEILNFLRNREPVLMECTELHFDRQPRYLMSGKEKQKRRFGEDDRTNIYRRYMEDGDRVDFFIPSTLNGKRPPVEIEIIPDTIETLEKLTGMKREEFGLLGKYYPWLFSNNSRLTKDEAGSILAGADLPKRHDYLRKMFLSNRTMEVATLCESDNKNSFLGITENFTDKQIRTVFGGKTISGTALRIRINMGIRDFKKLIGMPDWLEKGL